MVGSPLKQQAPFLNALIEHNPLGIVVLDQEYRVIACNPAFTSIFQWTESEIAGHLIDELIVPDTLRQEGIALSHQVMGGQPFRVVTRRRRKDGSLVDVEVLGVRLMVDNKLVGSFGLYQDISERVRLQQEMLESQKLESLGRLAGGVAHDINNMLTAITVHAQLLEAKLPPELQQHTAQICLASERASSTVQQLLAFGRKQPSFPRIIGLNATINELMSMLRPLIREDVGLNFVPFPEELHVQIDPAHFTQALVNLVVNARDAISGRGSIFIRTAVRNISASRAGEQGLKAGDYAMVEVMDTGSGMPPEVKKRVFEPFFTTKGMGKGTGLGLATVYGIVKQNQGEIDLWSEAGRGTSFQILLPLHQAPGAEENRDRRAELPGGHETILVAEDETAARQAIAEFLEGLGYSVLQAANGRDALALYHQKSSDIGLVVSDLIMPQMNGAEMAREIWRENNTLPVIFVSAYGDDEIRSKLPVTYTLLQKPFRLDSLALALRQKLDSRS